MKLAVLLILINTITLIRTAPACQVCGFEDGKQYVYEYKARSATGVAEEVTQFSGFGLRSKLIIQKTGQFLAFHMTNLELGSFNKKLDNVLDEVDIVYERLHEQSQEHNINLLEKYFLGEFKQGVFQAIYFTPGEDIAKHNNKKAIVSLFQLDLQREGRDFNQHAYVKHEDSWDGVCDTSYIIGHFPDRHRPNEDVLNVTKVRLYGNCSVQPHLFHSTVMGYKNPTSEQAFSPILKDYSETRYNLKGTREKYTIESIHAISGFTLSPFTSNGQTVMSMVNQSMTLLQVSDAPEFLLQADWEKHTSLYHEFNNDKIKYRKKELTTSHYYDRVFKEKRNLRLEMFESVYSELEAAIKRNESKLNHFIPRLTEIYQQFDYGDFVQVFDKHIFSNPKPGKITKEGLFATELLAFVGTNPAITFIYHIVSAARIHPNTAKRLIQKIPFYVKEPSKLLLDASTQFRKISIRKAYSNMPIYDYDHVEIYVLELSILLSYGTLLYKGCREDVFNPHPIDGKHYIEKQDCSRYVKDLINDFNQTQDIGWKVLFLETIMNARTEDVFEFAISLINSNVQHGFVRQNAMWALMGETGSRALQVKRTLVPIFLNHEEDYLVRLYAYYVLLYAYPSPTLFGKIIILLNSDPSEKFKSHIFSSLSAYAKSIGPDEQNFRELAKYVVKIASKTSDVKSDMNHVKIHSLFNEKYNYGLGSFYSIIPGAESILPREIFMSENINLFGYSFNLFEFAFVSSGATEYEDVLSHIAPDIIMPSFRPVKDELLLKTIKKFKFERGAIKESLSQFYFRTFYKGVFVADDVRNCLKGTSDWLYTDVNQTLYRQSLRYSNVELIKPNALGMPVFLKVDIPVTNNIHISKETSKTNETYLVSQLSWDFSIRSQIYVYSLLFGNLGFELQTNMGVHLPIKASASYTSENKLNIKYILSDEPYDLFYYKTSPQTFGTVNVPISYSSDTVQKRYSFGHGYFGAGISVNISHDRYWDMSSEQFSNYFSDSDLSTWDKIISGTRNLAINAILNPTAKPFSINVRFARCSAHPTTEFELETMLTLDEKDYGNFQIPAVNGNRFSAKLIAKGPTARKWEIFQSASFRWPQMDNPKVIAYFKRSPIPGYSNEPFEVCLNGKGQITDDYWNIFYLKPVDIEAEYKSTITWGKSCEKYDAKVSFKAIGEKSDEQKSVVDVPFRTKCNELVAKGNVINFDCWDTIKDLGRLDKFTYTIDYVNPSGKSEPTIFKRIKMWLRHKFYHNLHLDYSAGNNKPNHVEVTRNISYYHPDVMDVSVVQSDKMERYTDIRIPTNDPYTVAEQLTLSDRLLQKYFNYRKPTCIITGNYARTFDGLTYETNLKGCRYLAFSNPNKTFIYYRAVKTKKADKAATVYLNNNVIDFIPNDETIEVFKNGVQILRENNSSYSFNNDYLEIFKLPKDDYILLSKAHGLQFYFSGRGSYIKASYLYRGKPRGLCGNFDGEYNNDFEGPDGHVYDDGSSFAASYAVEDNCV